MANIKKQHPVTNPQPGTVIPGAASAGDVVRKPVKMTTPPKYELPVEPAPPVETMSQPGASTASMPVPVASTASMPVPAASTASAPAAPAAPTTSGYRPINETAAPGVDYDAYKDELDKQKEYLKNNPGVADGANMDDLKEQYGDVVNGTQNQFGGNSAKGYYTYSYDEARAAKEQGYSYTKHVIDGKEVYFIEGAPRPQQPGTSGADEDLLDDASYAIIQQLKAEYERCKAAGDKEGMERAHAQAEAIRANYGYTGGTDGSQYLTLGALGFAEETDFGEEERGPARGEASGKDEGKDEGGDAGGGGASEYDSSGLQALLDKWKEAALAQSDGKIDFAVAKAIVELERALLDAQPQFKEQAESIAKDEMQALDNSALYAEARGDKGGIGQSQYNEIQAAAAQNRLAVQQAQTKLSTDTARQIADLRAQGEFEKADKALEIAQTYLSKLIDIEMWAAEYNLSVSQFNASLEQWQAEFDLAMKQFETSVEQWEQQFKVDTDLAYGQLMGTLPSTGELTLSGKNQLISMGESLLSLGIMPSAEQLAAMGISEMQAQQIITAQQLEAASKGNGGSSSTGKGSGDGETEEETATSWEDLTSEEIWQELYNAGYTDSSNKDTIESVLRDMGVQSGRVSAIASAFVDDRYEAIKDHEAEVEAQNMAKFDAASVANLRLASVNYALLDSLIEAGIVEATVLPSGKIFVGWATGYGPHNYLSGLRSPIPNWTGGAVTPAPIPNWAGGKPTLGTAETRFN